MRYVCSIKGCDDKEYGEIGGLTFCLGHYQSLFRNAGCVLDERRARKRGPVVYYLGDPPTQLVKIGTTMRLPARFRELSRVRPELKLLAVEPGSRILESRRHHEFRHHQARVPGEVEWFHKVDRLMAHITRVRLTFGDPFEHYSMLG